MDTALLSVESRRLTSPDDPTRVIGLAVRGARDSGDGGAPGVKVSRHATSLRAARKEDPHRELWERSFAELQAYQKRHGHCNPQPRRRGEHQLAVWLMNQRVAFKHRRLPLECLLALQKLGASLNPMQEKWERKFAGLQAFLAKHGHTRVPQLWHEPRNLGLWASAQRNYYRLGRLPLEHEKRLEAIGFSWVVLGAKWETNFLLLTEYQRRHGHTDVPSHNDDPFAQWVHMQRVRRRNGTLNPEVERRLEAIGFAWKKTRRLGPVFDAKWEHHLAELSAFKAQHGHANVPQVRKGRRGPGVWLANVRKLKRTGCLPPERVAELEALGVDWNPQQQWWPQVLARLRAFHETHGHCRVKSTDPDQTLAGMVQRLRKKRRDGQLPAEQIAELDALGFLWFGERAKTAGSQGSSRRGLQ